MRLNRFSPSVASVPRTGALVERLEPRRLLAATPVRLGAETPVNTTTEFDQARPAVAGDGAGGFVVAWHSFGQDGSGLGVYARRYDAAGPVGPEFRANTDTASSQSFPAVAAAPDGFVVVWQGDGPEGDVWGISGQRYDAAGTPLGEQFAVSEAVAGRQITPSVAIAPDGRFVVAWADFGTEGDAFGVYARAFNADGTPRGPQFLVNTTVFLQQLDPAVGMAADGSFVVTWDGMVELGLFGVFARRFDAGASPSGDEFRVDEDARPDVREPSVALGPAGDFVVAWQSLGEAAGAGIYARRYAADGAAVGDALPVGVGSGDALPAISAAPGGGFAVAWQTGDPTAEGRDIFARRFGADGAASDAIPVNTHAAGDQFGAAVAFAADGSFLVAWQSAVQDGDGLGVYAQRLGEVATPPPVIRFAAEHVSVPEGDAGETLVPVTLLLVAGEDDDAPRPSALPVTVDLETVGDAIRGHDFALPARVTFAPGETSVTFHVSVFGDRFVEPGTRQFTMLLRNATNAVAGDRRGSHSFWIQDDDFAPDVLVGASGGPEGDGDAVREIPFSIRLSAAAGAPVTVRYVTRGGTAAAGADFVEADATVTFDAGEVEKVVRVRLVNDDVEEAEESFTLEASVVSGPASADVAAGTGTIVDDDWDVPPPTVTGVFVSGSLWTPAFRQAVAPADTGAGGPGAPAPGFLVPGGAAQLDELPWSNLNRVGVRFSVDVSVARDDLTVTGRHDATYPIGNFEYDPRTYTATWTLSRALANDRLELLLEGGARGVKAASSGAPLNGRWANGDDDYPTGDVSGPPQSLLFRLNVLPGDVTRDGAVSAADVVRVRSGRTAPVGGGYSVFHDVNGSGRVDAVDYALVRSRQGTTLPAPQAPAVGGSSLLVPRIAPVRRQLFSTTPILA